jgi:NitT/TauT family transport system substrate-binding protein
VPPALTNQINGPADLKGRKLAMTPPGLGTANGFVLTKYLAQANLTPNDVDIVPIPFPEQVAALTNRSVDAAIMAEPFATQAVLLGVGSRLVTLDKIDPGQQVAGIVFSERFIREHRDVGEKWVLAYVKGIRAYNAAFGAGTDKDRIVNILATKTDVKDPKLWNAMIPAGLHPDARLNVQSIADAEAFFTRLGLVQNAPPVDAFLDQSFTDAAVKALGPGPTPVPRPTP